MRRCGVCGRLVKIRILTVHGIWLGWGHRSCARYLGMAAVR